MAGSSVHAFLECAALNASILYREDIDPSMNHLNFLQILIDEVATPCLRSPIKQKTHQKISAKTTQVHEAAAGRFVGYHKPYHYSRGPGKDQRKTCVICMKTSGCRVRVNTSCATCHVGLCFSTHAFDKKPSCFDLYHDPSYDK